jgi:hypothetical protein
MPLTPFKAIALCGIRLSVSFFDGIGRCCFVSPAQWLTWFDQSE